MLASKGFTHRIDCTASPSNGMPGGQILVHLITVRDKPDEADNLWSKLEEGCDFIESAIASKYVIFLFFSRTSFLSATSTWYSCSATVYNQGILTTTTKFVLPSPHFSFYPFSSQSKILVHCIAGVSRSATVILYYLMTRTSMDLNLAQALRMVRQVRPIVSPNHGFMRLLCRVESEIIGKESSIDPDAYEKHRHGNPGKYAVVR